MFCFINKWLISRSLDLGKRLPALVTRHLGHCRSCREFYRLSESISRRLSREAAEFIRKRDNRLNEKILSALTAKSTPRLAPRFPRFPRFRPWPIPILAAASVVLVVAIGIVILTTPTAAPLIDKNPLDELSQLGIARTPLPEIAARLESPIDSEMQELRQSIRSASDFLLSCLDVQLVQPL
jgi:hypothetical protein